MRRACWTLLAAATMFAAAGVASAQTKYPTAPITIVVAWPPGSQIDVMVRHMSDPLREELGQPIIVDNKAGAAGVIGAQNVAGAKPDGYTLLFTSSALNMVAAMGTKTSYKVEDFVPIVSVSRTPLILVAHPSINVKTPQELVDLAKKKPGELFYAIAGYGAPSHFVAEMFIARTGIKAQAVSFRGSPDAMIDQVAGRVQFSIANASTALPQIKEKTIVPLAVTSRLPTAPELPTMEERGFKGFGMASYWSGLLGPKGMPMEIAERLAAAVNKVLANADVRAKLAASGNEVEGKSNPKSFAAELKEDAETWSQVAKTANIVAKK